MKHFASVPGDGYTTHPTKLRITSDHAYDLAGVDEHRWTLDAYDTRTGEYTELAWTYSTFEQAVDSMPAFVDELDHCRTR